MRTVLVRAFAVPRDYGIVWGKLFDVVLTIAVSALIVAWIAVSAYIALARTGGVALLSSVGLHNEQVMRPLTYVAGRLVAFVLLLTLFAALYKVLPNRKVLWRQALIGGATSTLLFEIARSLFTVITHHLNMAFDLYGRARSARLSSSCSGCTTRRSSSWSAASSRRCTSRDFSTGARPLAEKHPA